MEYLGKLIEVGQWISNCCSLNKKMQKLKRKFEDLNSREVDIVQELEYAESLCLKKQKKEVDNWLASVGRKKDEVRAIEKAVEQDRLLFTCVQLVKCVEDLTEEVTELLENGKFSEGLSFDTLEMREDAFFDKEISGSNVS